MSIKEYVLNNQEFKGLASTRIHWAVRRIALRCENGGGKVITTFEESLTLSVTSITKEGHILVCETKYGEAYPSSEEFRQWKHKICEDVKRNFPEATEGAWSHGD